MNEITVIKWEAFDGAIFDDASECVDYENDHFKHLAQENGIIFLNRDREAIAPCEVEQCEYLYIPDSKACDLIFQIFDLFELYSPLSAPQNVYNIDFEKDNPDICGWWVLDADSEIWRNLRIEAKYVRLMNEDLKLRTGVA